MSTLVDVCFFVVERLQKQIYDLCTKKSNLKHSSISTQAPPFSWNPCWKVIMM